MELEKILLKDTIELIIKTRGYYTTNDALRILGFNDDIVNANEYNQCIYAKYYKIGRHGKIEKLTREDEHNIDKFPKGTEFYMELPEEAIKLDI